MIKNNAATGFDLTDKSITPMVSSLHVTTFFLLPTVLCMSALDSFYLD